MRQLSLDDVLRGESLDGTPFEATGCVLIVRRVDLSFDVLVGGS